jgi:hypothetical protein
MDGGEDEDPRGARGAAARLGQAAAAAALAAAVVRWALPLLAPQAGVPPASSYHDRSASWTSAAALVASAFSLALSVESDASRARGSALAPLEPALAPAASALRNALPSLALLQMRGKDDAIREDFEGAAPHRLAAPTEPQPSRHALAAARRAASSLAAALAAAEWVTGADWRTSEVEVEAQSEAVSLGAASSLAVPLPAPAADDEARAARGAAGRARAFALVQDVLLPLLGDATLRSREPHSVECEGDACERLHAAAAAATAAATRGAFAALALAPPASLPAALRTAAARALIATASLAAEERVPMPARALAAAALRIALEHAVAAGAAPSRGGGGVGGGDRVWRLGAALAAAAATAAALMDSANVAMTGGADTDLASAVALLGSEHGAVGAGPAQLTAAAAGARLLADLLARGTTRSALLGSEDELYLSGALPPLGVRAFAALSCAVAAASAALAGAERAAALAHPAAALLAAALDATAGAATLATSPLAPLIRISHLRESWHAALTSVAAGGAPRARRAAARAALALARARHAARMGGADTPRPDRAVDDTHTHMHTEVAGGCVSVSDDVASLSLALCAAALGSHSPRASGEVPATTAEAAEVDALHAAILATLFNDTTVAASLGGEGVSGAAGPHGGAAPSLPSLPPSPRTDAEALLEALLAQLFRLNDSLSSENIVVCRIAQVRALDWLARAAAAVTSAVVASRGCELPRALARHAARAVHAELARASASRTQPSAGSGLLAAAILVARNGSRALAAPMQPSGKSVGGDGAAAAAARWLRALSLAPDTAQSESTAWPRASRAVLAAASAALPRAAAWKLFGRSEGGSGAPRDARGAANGGEADAAGDNVPPLSNVPSTSRALFLLAKGSSALDDGGALGAAAAAAVAHGLRLGGGGAAALASSLVRATRAGTPARALAELVSLLNGGSAGSAGSVEAAASRFAALRDAAVAPSGGSAVAAAWLPASAALLAAHGCGDASPVSHVIDAAIASTATATATATAGCVSLSSPVRAATGRAASDAAAAALAALGAGASARGAATAFAIVSGLGRGRTARAAGDRMLARARFAAAAHALAAADGEGVVPPPSASTLLSDALSDGDCGIPSSSLSPLSPLLIAAGAQVLAGDARAAPSRAVRGSPPPSAAATRAVRGSPPPSAAAAPPLPPRIIETALRALADAPPLALLLAATSDGVLSAAVAITAASSPFPATQVEGLAALARLARAARARPRPSAPSLYAAVHGDDVASGLLGDRAPPSDAECVRAVLPLLLSALPAMARGAADALESLLAAAQHGAFPALTATLCATHTLAIAGAALRSGDPRVARAAARLVAAALPVRLAVAPAARRAPLGAAIFAGALSARLAALVRAAADVRVALPALLALRSLARHAATHGALLRGRTLDAAAARLAGADAWKVSREEAVRGISLRRDGASQHAAGVAADVLAALAADPATRGAVAHAAPTLALALARAAMATSAPTEVKNRSDSVAAGSLRALALLLGSAPAATALASVSPALGFLADLIAGPSPAVAASGGSSASQSVVDAEEAFDLAAVDAHAALRPPPPVVRARTAAAVALSALARHARNGLPTAAPLLHAQIVRAASAAVRRGGEEVAGATLARARRESRPSPPAPPPPPSLAPRALAALIDAVAALGEASALAHPADPHVDDGADAAAILLQGGGRVLAAAADAPDAWTRGVAARGIAAILGVPRGAIPPA